MSNINTKIKLLDVHPIIKYYMEELSIEKLFNKHIPFSSKMSLSPASVLSMMILNIICTPTPLYTFSEWIADYIDGLGESPEDAKKYNDDCLARNLDRLYSCDRNSLMVDITANAINTHKLDLSKIHNDSTTITFKGCYKNQTEEAVNLCRGHNKDFRPDCLQVVYGLNITEDGHIPLSYQLFNGNQSDDTTHISNWDQLREMLNKPDFTYIADCKLCSSSNLDHIHSNNGKFISIVPKNRTILKPFSVQLENDEVEWKFAYNVPDNRTPSKKNEFYTFESAPTDKGYRLIWIKSTSKVTQDQKTRNRRILKAEKKLTELSEKINSYNLKSKKQIHVASSNIIKDVENLIDVKIITHNIKKKKKVGTGRPGKNSIYTESISTYYEIQWEKNLENIAKNALSDGIFPLITNTAQDCSEILRTYKHQASLEKRFSTMKSITKVAPVFLKKTSRIEAVIFLYFIALMIISLIERQIRKEMALNSIEKIAIRPNQMNTTSPTWNNISYLFRNIHVSQVFINNKLVNQKIKGLEKIHKSVLELLNVPISKYIRIYPC